jgi:hypothetical protein
MARNDFIYIEQKIEHLKRAGLVGPKSTGIGFNGGAAPDWLVAEQKARREGYAKRRAADFVASIRG